jgi:hypothetical protein
MGSVLTHLRIHAKEAAMKRLTLVAVIVAGALAVPGSASAKGNGVSCQPFPGGTVFSSPGQMFRDARKSFGWTPAEMASTLGFASVGDLIQHACTSGRGGGQD